MPVPLQAGAAAGGGGGGGGVAGVAQQLAAGLAAALQQGGNGGNVGPGLHIHHVAIPLGNLNLPPGFGGAAAAAGPGMQWQAFPAGQPGGGGAGAGPGNGNANGDDDTPSPDRARFDQHCFPETAPGVLRLGSPVQIGRDGGTAEGGCGVPAPD